MTKLAEATTPEKKVATDLFEALTTKKPLVMADYTNVVTDYDSAYRVQHVFTDLKHEDVAGYKVSLTSEETQRMFDSDSPFYGVEVASSWVKSGSKVELSGLMDPLLEVELVFTAKEKLLPSDTLEELLDKTTVSAGVELPDSRFKDWFPELSKYLVVSDSAVAGRVVYGANTTKKVSVEDLATVHATLTQDGKQLAEGDSAEVLGNPLKSVQWLVNKLAGQGYDFPAGTRVSSGTFLLPPHATAGHYVAHFDKFFDDVSFDLV